MSHAANRRSVVSQPEATYAALAQCPDQAAERALQTAIVLGRGERKEWALRVWLRLFGVAFPSVGAP